MPLARTGQSAAPLLAELLALHQGDVGGRHRRGISRGYGAPGAVGELVAARVAGGAGRAGAFGAVA